MTINLQMPDIRELRPRITVFGVGGAGGNAVNNMISSGLSGVEFVVAIGRDADAADHHPDVDLRYDHVDVRLTSHDVGGLSRRDGGLGAGAHHRSVGDQGQIVTGLHDARLEGRAKPREMAGEQPPAETRPPERSGRAGTH